MSRGDEAGRLGLDPVSFAPPATDPEEARGSPLHERMLEVARQTGGGGPLHFRTRGLDTYHRLKIRFMIRQPHFPLRALNYALYRLERGRRARVHYFPPILHIETNATCNLRCPGCVTGLQLPAGSRKGRARMDTIRSVVDQARSRCFQVNLHRQGEPLLSPLFASACAYAVEKGLWTAAHSNLSLGDRDLPRTILNSRLCNLVVSCDGATQATYEKYRRGGRLERVLDNIRGIAEAKRSARSRFPWITAKFVVFDHNWHEMEQFKATAMECGADDVLFVAGLSGSIYTTGRAATESEFNLATLRWEKRRIAPLCDEIWTAMGVDHDGGVSPCCYAYSDEHLFVTPEQAARSPLMRQWNSDSYVAARAFFLARSASDPSKLPAPCATCEYPVERLRELRSAAGGSAGPGGV